MSENGSGTRQEPEEQRPDQGKEGKEMGQKGVKKYVLTVSQKGGQKPRKPSNNQKRHTSLNCIKIWMLILGSLLVVAAISLLIYKRAFCRDNDPWVTLLYSIVILIVAVIILHSVKSITISEKEQELEVEKRTAIFEIAEKMSAPERKDAVFEIAALSLVKGVD